jgi:hypothetical protein
MRPEGQRHVPTKCLSEQQCLEKVFCLHLFLLASLSIDICLTSLLSCPLLDISVLLHSNLLYSTLLFTLLLPTLLYFGLLFLWVSESL